MCDLKYKVMVRTTDRDEWAGNNMRYETREEAEEAAKALASRWMLVKEWRVDELL